MRVRGYMKVAMVLALIAVSLFALGGAAFASTGNNGPNNPPVVSDPVGTNVTPHGGFSTTTNFCLQCHSVHTAPGGGTEGYALLAEPSVVDVCATCHGLFGASSGTGANPNTVPGNTGTLGTASSRTAYDLTGATKLASHDIGETNIPDETIPLYQGGWQYGGFNPGRWDGTKEIANGGTSSYGGGGLYCGSCHTPHGDFGQAVNTKYFRSDAGGAVNEIQRVYVRGMVTGDTFTLAFDGQVTAPISYSATGATLDANILAALVGLSNIDAGDVTVASQRVTFQGVYASADVPTMVAATGTCAGACEAYAGTQNDGGPGGTLDASYQWKENALIYASTGADLAGSPTTVYYLHNTAAPATTGTWQKCTLPDGGGTCFNLVHNDAEGQLSYVYGYKILQAYPNHDFDQVESFGVGYRGRDAARWCGSCHPSKVSSEFGAAFTEHNHPTDCTYCHGNPPTGTGASADYPHTSTQGKFLKQYPDGLCVSCHGAGSLL